MRGTRTDAGRTTNKDLDTGGYTAKTCEASAAMTGGKESQAMREAVPPQAGRGNMKSPSAELLDVRCAIGRSIVSAEGLQMQGGWAYYHLPRAGGLTG